MGYITENKVLIPTDEGYKSLIKVLDNGSNGFFFVGTIQTPRAYIGKKVRLNVEIVEDEE